MIRQSSRDLSRGFGLAFKPPFHTALKTKRFNLDFLEVHAENYFCGGRDLRHLKEMAEIYPISLHGIGLSLGGSEPPDTEALAQWRRLVKAINPALISEHAAFTRIGNAHFNDLLPLRYDGATLSTLARNVEIFQEAIGRRVLIENLSSYLTYANSVMTEAEFLNALCQKTGCGILLDINNIYVQFLNHGFDCDEYLRAVKPEYVGEYHMAGGERYGDTGLVVDTHGAPTPKPVCDLYNRALARIGPRPTLLERDNNIPPLETLIDELNMIRQSCFEAA